MNCIPESIPLVFACINCWINKISLAPRTYANCQTSLNIMLACFLYCFYVLVVWVHLWFHLSLIGGFLVGCCLARNKWYQSISGSSWDRISILRVLVVVRRRSCVDLETALGLFVGSCVDLKTAFELLEESIRRSRSLRKLFEGFTLR